MSDEHTTAVVQHYLDALAGDLPAEPIVRALLDRAVRRLQLLCTNLLYASYPRLTRPPLNLQPRTRGGRRAMFKAMRQAIPIPRAFLAGKPACAGTQRDLAAA